MMRIIIFIIFAIASFNFYSQQLSNNNTDLGILLSRENNSGTARFNALSGAFGALGGDISSTTINPAGAAVAKISSLSITYSNINSDYTTRFTTNKFNSSYNNNNISQIGGLLAFKGINNSKWNRFSLFFNYNQKNNSERSYIAEGFSTPIYNQHFLDAAILNQFNQNNLQSVFNETSIKTNVLSLGFSSVYNNKLFIGSSLKIHDLKFNEFTSFFEENQDVDNNISEIENFSNTYIEGNGISLDFGVIYKVNKNIRIGLAYETPTWYQEALKDRQSELFMGAIENLEIDSSLLTNENTYLFSYNSASRITASGAYIFGKRGLISVDYTYRDYSNISFENNNSSNTNETFDTDFRNTYSLKVGTEWRFNKLSIRGGFSYEKDPNLTIGASTNEDNIESFSLGLGYKFTHSQFDLSYSNAKNTNFENIADSEDLTIANSISTISGTLTINL